MIGSRFMVVMITIVYVSTQCEYISFCQDVIQVIYAFGKKKSKKKTRVNVSDDLLLVMFADQKRNGSEKNIKKIIKLN